MVRRTTGGAGRDDPRRLPAGWPRDRPRPADTSGQTRRLVARVFPMATSILIVDDSAVSRSIIIRSLPPGWDVAITQASNGHEALIALQQKPYAVVLLDLNMPVMDGYEFLEAMNRSGLALPTVIVLSGDIQPGAQSRVRDLGARAFVQKPVRMDRVLGALKE